MADITLGRGSLIKANLIVGQGQTNSFAVAWWPNGKDEPPQDFTGWTARMQARRRPGMADAWFTVSTEGGDGSIELTSEGQIFVTINPEVTSRWGTSNKDGTWDLELVDPDGVVITFARGDISVELETTTHGDDE